MPKALDYKTVTIPIPMLDELKARSLNNHRSLSGEISYRLQESLRSDLRREAKVVSDEA